MPTDPSDDREPVEQLAEQFAQEQRSGQNPSIEAYAQQHPEHAAEIRDLFPALLVIEELSPAGETRNRHEDATNAGPPVPERIGDYEVVREIGRGGMGVVYEAQQRSLARRVALKILPYHAVGNVEFRKRFQREAEAAARLDHPHIVPVYEVGEYDACPYFSMKFVDGTTLLDELERGPIDPGDAVDLLLPITNAIAAAHRAGVLHRDLKPSNILLSSERQPLVADFGLAKTFQPGDVVSHTQPLMGTPSYMAPEQASANGERVSAATDVYGLGAVLYHMLTGRPPFQAATSIDTMRQVTHQEPVSPRQLNGTISKDLETICLKCLAKNPAHRYASATALEEDLQRYRRGEPILARRLGLFTRCRRWCRRHPMRAAALAMLLVTCIVSLAAYITTANALKQSELSHRQTREVVDHFLRRVSEDPRFDQHGLQSLRGELLREAQDHYERFLQSRGDDPSLQAEIADTHFRLGLIKEHIDTLSAAMADYETAEKMQRVLAMRSKSPAAREALSKTLAAMGRVSFRQHEMEDAKAFYAETLALRQQLVQEDNAHEYERLLANGHMNLGLIAKEDLDFDAAQAEFDQAESLRRKLLEKLAPENSLQSIDVRRDLGKGLINMAGLQIELIKWDEDNLTPTDRERLLSEAEIDLTEATRLFEELVNDEPDNPEHAFHLAICWRTLADVKTRVGPAAALEWYAQAVPQLEDLVLANPHVMDYQIVLAGAYMNLAQAKFRKGQAELAIDQFHHARRGYEILLRAKQGETARHRYHLALCQRSIGELEASRGNFELAKVQLTLALEGFAKLMAEFPDREEYAKQQQSCGQAQRAIEGILAKQEDAKDG